MVNCKYCGRELRCIGGYYSPIFESCTCGGAERAEAAKKAESERRSAEIQAKRESCSHEWHIGIMDNCAFAYCPKCGETADPQKISCLGTAKNKA